MFKKNQKNRAFMAAIAMLLLSAIVITTASFAWFTLGRNAMASNLDLKVTKQGEGIQISANTTTFTDELTFEDLNGTATSGFQAVSEEFNYFPAEISPTSTAFSLNKLPAFFTGGIDKALGTLESFASTSADGLTIYGKSGAQVPAGGKRAGFYAFDVFIKYSAATPGGTAQVKIGQTAITVKDDASDGTTANEEAVQAMRIGFVNCGTVTEGATPPAADSGSEAVIFATNEAARNTAPITSTGVSGTLADGTSTVPASAAGGLTIKSGYDCAVETGSEDQTLTLQDGINQIRIYIWMEGQDAACTDKLQSQLVSSSLVFTMV
ncbi:MAG: hypothetical protein IKT61_03240 [Clostridia bacterium]|nr:hypothetical protein [Clostridia bacterium]